jgi:hypothetical protein
LEENIEMEKFNVTELKIGEKILIKTETGSTYHLEAENIPEPIGESQYLFGGLRATRESDHDIVGRPELIENEAALLVIRGDEPGVLQAGEQMEVIWDSDHPDSKADWDIQFGPKFHPVTTSRILDIQFIPVRIEE